MNIRPAVEADFAGMWPIFRAVVAAQTTYVFCADTPYHDAFAYWFSSEARTFVSEEDGQIIGMYKLMRNQRDLGAHVSNASFMVDPHHSGRGAGRLMGEHCLLQASKAGYKAMQFNFVVSTNLGAITLWRRLGFSIVGTLPKAFLHKTLGYVDAYVMHRFLDEMGAEEKNSAGLNFSV